MNRLAALILVALSAVAQTNNPEIVRKFVDLKHLSGDRAERAIKLIRSYMHPVGSIDFDPALKTAVLIGPEKVVTGGEALLAKFDSPNALRPEPQIEFRFYLVEGSADGAVSGAIPAEISSAVEQMKKNFLYKGYRLIDTILLRAKASQANGSAEGMLPTESPRVRPYYMLRYLNANVLEDGKTVALRDFIFLLRVPLLDAKGNQTLADSKVQADLSIQEGQKLVVGKLSAEQPQNAVFVILTVDVQ
jgi:hypothetical protein